VHDAEYRQSEKDWYSFVEKISERLMAVDDTIPELPVKDIVSLPSVDPCMKRLYFSSSPRCNRSSAYTATFASARTRRYVYVYETGERGPLTAFARQQQS